MESANNRQIPNDDVLLKILSLCDISTVIAFSETTWHFYYLANSRQVWLALLSGLYRRDFLDLEPGKQLKDLSKTELVDLAKRTVLGPRSLSSESGTNETRIERQVILKPQLPHGPGVLYWENEMLLLPRGDFVLLRHLGLECIDVACDKVIWRYNGSWSSYNAQAFTAELVNDGKAAIIVVGVRTYDTIADRKNFLEVLRLDLDRGSSTSLLLRSAPSTDHDNPFRRLRINGDFVVAATGFAPQVSIVILQVSTGLCCTWQVPMDGLVDLMPGHLIVLRDGDRLGTLNLSIWELHALVQYGTHTGTIPITTIPPVNTEMIDVSMVPSPTFRLSCHASPLYSESSRLWIFISSRPTSEQQPHTLFLKYHITHCKGRAVSIRSKSRWEHAGSIFFPPLESCEISYSGSVETWRARQHFFFLAGEEACNKTIDLPGCGDHTHSSPYSSALTYCTHEAVIINYYE